MNTKPPRETDVLAMERYLLEHQDELGIEPVGTRERNGITLIVWKPKQPSAE